MDNLLKYSLNQDPLKCFLDWYDQAQLVEQNAQAMSVSTFDTIKNRPSSRYILFKGAIDNRLIFYTNYLSPKSKDLSMNPEVALNFYWHVSKKQVRIHGLVEKMNSKDSEEYFSSRDRDSQIASYLSEQSAKIEDKNELLKMFAETKAKFEGKNIPCPTNWGGYLVTPYEYEFFLYGDNRLNDRFLYQIQNEKWEVSRLQP